jgi:hypothetical protein
MELLFSMATHFCLCYVCCTTCRGGDWKKVRHGDYHVDLKSDYIRLSLTNDLYSYPNSKWGSKPPKTSFNERPIPTIDYRCLCIRDLKIGHLLLSPIYCTPIRRSQIPSALALTSPCTRPDGGLWPSERSRRTIGRPWHH